ncbi:MAG: hypothetical protein MUE46_17420, partial [Xanthomonadales bacterium]|nr:hypothetical protein [Xanthomonadales bacterium]
GAMPVRERFGRGLEEVQTVEEVTHRVSLRAGRRGRLRVDGAECGVKSGFTGDCRGLAEVAN